MKRHVLTTASLAMVTLAGFAIAGILTAKPSPPVELSSGWEPRPPPAPIPAKPVTRTEASVSPETIRQPVPIAVIRRPASATPSAGQQSETPSTADLAARKASEAVGKAAIEADGYKGVRMLTQGPDGIWKATALRGQTRIVVFVDPAGNVSAE